MKVLGINFSYRKDGNCFKTLSFCLNELSCKGEILNLYDYEINPCRNCNYVCFEDLPCSIEDDINLIYEKCFSSNKIIFALPTYGGHLAAAYFIFSERQQAIFKNETDYYHHFLKKISYILIGNDYEMPLSEILSSYVSYQLKPQIIVLSTNKYHERSISGNLIKDNDVKQRLSTFSRGIISCLK